MKPRTYWHAALILAATLVETDKQCINLTRSALKEATGRKRITPYIIRRLSEDLAEMDMHLVVLTTGHGYCEGTECALFHNARIRVKDLTNNIHPARDLLGLENSLTEKGIDPYAPSGDD